MRNPKCVLFQMLSAIALLIVLLPAAYGQSKPVSGGTFVKVPEWEDPQVIGQNKDLQVAQRQVEIQLGQ